MTRRLIKMRWRRRPQWRKRRRRRRHSRLATHRCVAQKEDVYIWQLFCVQKGLNRVPCTIHILLYNFCVRVCRCYSSYFIHTSSMFMFTISDDVSRGFSLVKFVCNPNFRHLLLLLLYGTRTCIAIYIRNCVPARPNQLIQRMHVCLKLNFRFLSHGACATHSDMMLHILKFWWIQQKREPFVCVSHENENNKIKYV